MGPGDLIPFRQLQIGMNVQSQCPDGFWYNSTIINKLGDAIGTVEVTYRNYTPQATTRDSRTRRAPGPQFISSCPGAV